MSIHKKRYKYDKFYRAICDALYETIDIHDNITKKYVPSAAKRISGKIKTELHNLKQGN